MAYRKKGKKNDPSYKKMKKSGFTPANRFLRYQISVPANSTERSFYLDIAKDLSACNRRLYRQQKVYQVANISVTSRNTTNGLVSFATAPDTWVTREALRRGFLMHEEMKRKVLDMPGSMTRKGRWNDYKVYLSDDHRTATTVQLPRPRDNGNNQAGSGEWVYSTYQSPDGSTSADEFTSHILGDHSGSAGNWNSISLIKSYGEARASVQVDTPLVDSEGSDDPLLNLFDYGTEIDEIAFDMANDGDNPPYKVNQGGDNATIGEHYPGSESNLPKPFVNRIAAIGLQGGVGAPTIMLPGFTAIAGLIEIECQSAGPADSTLDPQEDTFDILIELSPGGYKGVAAFDI
jgi:hypothetical protein